MTNLIGIDDVVKVKLKGEGREEVAGNNETVTITQIQKIQGEIYYTGEYHYICPVTKVEYDSSIQFKEGEYIIIPVEENIND